MLIKREILEMLIVGVTAGATAACLNFIARSPVGAGEILTFAGGAVGAGGALIGALWIDGRKDDRRREAFQGALEFIVVAASNLRNAADPHLSASITSLFQAFESFRQLRAVVQVDDPLANVGLVNVAAVYGAVERFLAPAREEIDAGTQLTPVKRQAIMERSEIVMDTTLRMMSSLALFDQKRVKRQRLAHYVPDLAAAQNLPQ